MFLHLDSSENPADVKKIYNLIFSWIALKRYMAPKTICPSFRLKSGELPIIPPLQLVSLVVMKPIKSKINLAKNLNWRSQSTGGQSP